MKKKVVLGIETSCDDTSVAIIQKDDDYPEQLPQILAHKSFSQEILLKKWGGVVPELAARNHLQKLTPLLEECFSLVDVKPSELDLIGVTTHPGLLGPLLTGINAAKSLSLLHQTPIFPVNHLFAHIEAIHLTDQVSYPYLGVIVSGGHSLFVLAHNVSNFEIVGTTIDDAAGEAFDKGAKLLGLGYPGGKIIDDLSKLGDPKRFDFPIGLRHSKDATLSFSGVKTALRTFLDNNPTFIHPEGSSEYSKDLKDLCASYQESIVAALVTKTFFAKKIAENISQKSLTIVVGGGVAASSRLRTRMIEEFGEVKFVKMSYCTDNGAMIAGYALRRFQDKIDYPTCLELDAKDRFVKKEDFIK